jgi:glycerol kinase
LIGDSHSAAFGEGCFFKGQAKATLGTGCSIMMNIGNKPHFSQNNMLTTILYSINNQVIYAFEGAIVSCGSTVEWLRNELNLFSDPAETEAMAQAVPDNAGVYLIPAFSGLGAPHWQMQRKASIEGLSFGSTKNHIVRAALESIAYQVKDVLDAMQKDIQTEHTSLAVNGGISKNTFVISFLSELLQTEINIQKNPDISALGAAYLSGLEAGVYSGLEQIHDLISQKSSVIKPSKELALEVYYKQWRKKIEAFK